MLSTPFSKKRGLTLVEMIMVMVIVATLASIAIPRLRALDAVRLNGAVKKAVSDIRFIQQLAISSHDDYRIVFDAALNKYEAFKVSDGSYAVNPFNRNNFIINFNSDPQFTGIDIASAAFNSGNVLRFDWQGAPKDASGADLSSEGSVRLSYQGLSFTIYVTPHTGRVRYQ